MPSRINGDSSVNGIIQTSEEQRDHDDDSLSSGFGSPSESSRTGEQESVFPTQSRYQFSIATSAAEAALWASRSTGEAIFAFPESVTIFKKDTSGASAGDVVSSRISWRDWLDLQSQRRPLSDFMSV